jgi:Flp pilus assembly protein TadD
MAFTSETFIKILKRTAFIFGASYFLWHTFIYDWLEQEFVWPVIEQLDLRPIFIPVGLLLVITGISLFLTILTYKINNPLFVGGVITVGVIADFISLLILGLHSFAMIALLTIHFGTLIIMGWAARAHHFQPVYSAGVVILLCIWLGTPLTPYTRQNLVEQGIAYYNANQYDKAIYTFTLALNWTPDSAANLWLAQSYQANDSLEQALMSLNKAVELLSPDNPGVYLSIVNMYLTLGDVESAVKISQQAQLLFSDNEQVQTDLSKLYHDQGEILYQAGKFSEAVNRYQQALEIAPNALNTRISLAKAYHAQGMDAQALNELQTIVEIDPEHELAKQAQQVLDTYR